MAASMLIQNHTWPMGFTLLGLTDDPALQVPLFLLFLAMYFITLMGNSGIILVVRSTPRLHTPMYYFLSHLSIIDIGYSSTTALQNLKNLLSLRKDISFIAFATQMFFFVGLGSAELLLLTLMALDRYMAVCEPLRYSSVMTKQICIWMVISAYIGGFIHSLLETGFTFHLTFCASREIHHFFCDVPPLLKLSCSDTTLNERLLFGLTGTVFVGSLTFVLISYGCLLIVLLGIRTDAGRWTAFSTCTSHFVAVTPCFGTLLFMYLRPSSMHSLKEDMVVAVLYAVVLPMLNPLVYSLRNRELKDALWTVILRR